MDCAATYMCEEIVIEILSRLPAKSLIRFLAVCRMWKSIITSPQFWLVSNRRTKFLVHNDRACYSLPEGGDQNHLTFVTDFPFKHNSSDSVEAIGSDNGLLCIGIRDLSRGRYNCYNRVIIWNPLIRKHVVVIPDNDKSILYSEHACGFGGTTSGDDYKYVRVVRLLDSFEKAVDIYSLKTGTWRRKYLDSDFEIGLGGITNTLDLVRGRLHWIVFRCRKEIYSFELEDEVFENKIMLPESIQPLGKNVYVDVTVIRESLAVIATETGQHSSTVGVWMMEEYGDVKSWIKLCNVDLEEFCWVDRKMVHSLKGDELLLGLRGPSCPSTLKLVTYNSKTMKTRDFGGGSLSFLTEVCGFTYKESLVLLGDDYYHAAANNWGPFFHELVSRIHLVLVTFCSCVGKVVRQLICFLLIFIIYLLLCFFDCLSNLKSHQTRRPFGAKSKTRRPSEKSPNQTRRPLV